MPTGAVALGGELGGRRAHDHPVPLADRAAEQTITNRTAYQVHLHRLMLTESRKLLRIVLLLAGVKHPAGLRQPVSAAGRARAGADPGGPAPDQGGRRRIRRRPRRCATRWPRSARPAISPAQTLGLPDNRSYRVYADIGRPYVVWNVVAAPEFSVRPKVWCFPGRRMRHLPRLFPPEIRPGLRRQARRRRLRHGRRRRTGLFHSRAILTTRS